ncbi:MAG: hypothetical protein WCL23_03810 [Candidatus Moraniibacteriota bacterium]
MRVETGNLNTENSEYPARKGWVVGDLVPEMSLMHSDDVSLKWVTHAKGTKKSSGADLDTETRTITLLLSGSWLTRFSGDGKAIILSTPGDYLTYEGAALHENEALEESRLIVFRWTERR